MWSVQRPHNIVAGCCYREDESTGSDFKSKKHTSGAWQKEKGISSRTRYEQNYLITYYVYTKIMLDFQKRSLTIRILKLANVEK